MSYRIKKVVLALRKYSDVNYWRTRNMIFLIYNASKVGSSTVLFSLKSKLWFSPTLHVHFLSNDTLNSIKKSGKWLDNIRKADEVKSVLDQHKSKKIKIITLVREPISREISAVFQSWDILFGIENIDDLQMKDVVDHLDDSPFNHTEKWFETEFKKYTNLDILDLPFDKSKGYSIYRFSKFDVLCIRMESLNSSLESSISDFIGVNGLELKLTNVSKNKGGSDMYTQLKATYKLGKEKVDEVYSTRFMNHFYTREEIDQFTKQWIKSNH